MWLKVLVPHPLVRIINPTFRTQAIREGIGLQNTIKLKKGENFREAARKDWDVGELTEVWLGERRTYEERSVLSPVQW